MRANRLLLCGALLAAPAAQAGGFGIDEQDAAAIGRGDTAGARIGPSAAYYNPAGLVGVGPAALELGLTAVAPAATATNDQGTSTDAKSEVFLPPYLYAAHSEERWAAGVSFNAPFGLGVTWPEDFEDRYQVQKVTFQSLAFMASGAFRIIPALSVGASLGAVRTSIDITQKVDFVTNDGTAHLLASGWGFAAILGARYAVNDLVQFGLSGSLPTPTSLSGVARFSDVPESFAPLTADQDIKTRLTLPAKLRLGASVHPAEPIRVDAELAYTFWSAFKSLDIQFADPRTPAVSQTKNWHDTFTAKLGGEYELKEIATLRAGVSFDGAASPVSTMGPDAPDGNRYGLTVGAGRELWNGLRADLAYGFLLLDGRTSTEPNYPAHYEGHAHALSLAVSWALPEPKAEEHPGKPAEPLPRPADDGPGGLKSGAPAHPADDSGPGGLKSGS